MWKKLSGFSVLTPSGNTGLRPLAEGRTPEPLRLLLVLLPFDDLWALGPCRAAVIAAMAALNSCAQAHAARGQPFSCQRDCAGQMGVLRGVCVNNVGGIERKAHNGSHIANV